MTARKAILAGLIIVAAAALASLLIRARTETKLRENDELSQQQESQLAELVAENQRLSNLVAQAASATSSAPAAAALAELARLRAKADALRQQSNQMTLQLAQSRQAAGTARLSKGDYDLLDHNMEKTMTLRGGPRETGKLNDARAFGDGLLKYASDHDGQFPTDLDQVSSYLPKASATNPSPWQNTPVTGTNDFEIVFQGSQSDLTNIPARRVVLLRERNPWQTPDGKWARVYGYADGAASLVESDDNFQSWEAQHIVPSQTTGR